VSPRAFVERKGAGETAGEVGIEGTTIEEAEAVRRWQGSRRQGAGTGCKGAPPPRTVASGVGNVVARAAHERSRPPAAPPPGRPPLQGTPGLPALKLKYYTLLIRYHSHSNNYLGVRTARRRTELSVRGRMRAGPALAVALQASRPLRPSP
jgi:hypothetical protein